MQILRYNIAVNDTELGCPLWCFCMSSFQFLYLSSVRPVAVIAVIAAEPWWGKEEGVAGRAHFSQRRVTEK